MVKVSEEHETLYHYTDQAGLEGILSSQSLWASHYKNLNDEKEIFLFMQEILPDILRPELEKVYLDVIFSKPIIGARFVQSGQDISDVIKKDTDVLIRSMFDALKDELYIASFCGKTNDPDIDNHGLLSQWRGYGAGGGYCIVLDTKGLEACLETEYSSHAHMHLALSDVVYSNDLDKMHEEFKSEIAALISYMPSVKDTIIKTLFKRKVRAVPYKEFVSCITRFKHFGFKEEREVRVVSHLLPRSYSAAQEKRPRKAVKNINDKRPYIGLFDNIDEPLPIHKIIVGPHKDKIKRAEKLRKELKGTGVEITVSEIPYIEKK